MVVVVEALAFAGAFFIWYNISIHHRQELRGYLVALFYL